MVIVFIPSVTLYSFVIGIFALALYGVPLYLALIRTNNANFITISLVGALPGILFSIVSYELGLLLLLFGSSTAVVIHWMNLRSGLLSTLTKANN